MQAHLVSCCTRESSHAVSCCTHASQVSSDEGRKTSVGCPASDNHLRELGPWSCCMHRRALSLPRQLLHSVSLLLGASLAALPLGDPCSPTGTATLVDRCCISIAYRSSAQISTRKGTQSMQSEALGSLYRCSRPLRACRVRHVQLQVHHRQTVCLRVRQQLARLLRRASTACDTHQRQSGSGEGPVATSASVNNSRLLLISWPLRRRTTRPN